MPGRGVNALSDVRVAVLISHGSYPEPRGWSASEAICWVWDQKPIDLARFQEGSLGPAHWSGATCGQVRAWSVCGPALRAPPRVERVNPKAIGAGTSRGNCHMQDQNSSSAEEIKMQLFSLRNLFLLKKKKTTTVVRSRYSSTVTG